MATEADEQEQAGSGGRADDRVVVGCDVVTTGVGRRQSRVGHVGEQAIQFADRGGDDVVAGAVGVGVRIGPLGGRVVAVADEQVAVRLAPEVLQVHQIRECGHIRCGGSLVDEQNRLALHAYGDVDAGGGAERRRPCSRREHHCVRVDFGSVGENDTVDFAVPALQKGGDLGRLPDSDPEASCLRGVGHTRHIRVAVPSEGFVGERREIVEGDTGPYVRDLVGVERLHGYTQIAVHLGVGGHGCDVVRAHSHDVPGLPEADVRTEDLLGSREDLNPVPGHRRERSHTVVAADDPARFSGHAGTQRVSLENEDVGFTAFGK